MIDLTTTTHQDFSLIKIKTLNSYWILFLPHAMIHVRIRYRCTYIHIQLLKRDLCISMHEARLRRATIEEKREERRREKTGEENKSEDIYIYTYMWLYIYHQYSITCLSLELITFLPTACLVLLQRTEAVTACPTLQHQTSPKKVHIPFHELNQSPVQRLIIEQCIIVDRPEICDQRLVTVFLCFLCCLFLINLLLKGLYHLVYLSVQRRHRLGSNFGCLLGMRSKWVDVDASAFVVLCVVDVSILFFIVASLVVCSPSAPVYRTFPNPYFWKSNWHRSDTDVTGEVKSTKNQGEVNKNLEWSAVKSEQFRNEIQVESNRTHPPTLPPHPPLSNLPSDFL